MKNCMKSTQEGDFLVSVTIFTPAYNRAYTLEMLYQSLLRQTSKDFEWVVVDDGSTDSTSDLISKWTKEDNGFDIKYVIQENGGKHRAINKGIDLANGSLFMVVDSDDFLIDAAVSLIIESEKQIKNKTGFAGVAFNRGRDGLNIIGSSFKGEYVDATSLERRKYNILGDKAEVFYTHILKKYKFPEVPGEKFISENIVWYKIAHDGYKIRWFNQIIYICNYLPDGLTKNTQQLALNNFTGLTLTTKQILEYKVSIIEKMMVIGTYTRTGKIKGFTYRDLSRNINSNIIISILLSNVVNNIRWVKKLISKIK